MWRRRVTAGLIVSTAVLVVVFAGAAGAWAVPNGSVAGLVTDKRNGAAVPGITAVLMGKLPYGWATTATAVTGLDGRYTIDIAPGDYKISFRDDKGLYASQPWPSRTNDASFAVLPAQTMTCDTSLSPAAHLRAGLVTEATGGPVPSGALHLTDYVEDAQHQTSVNTSGWGTMRGLFSGFYELFGTTTLPGFLPHAYFYGKDGRGGIDLTAMATATVSIPVRHAPGTYKDVVRKAGDNRYDTALRLANEGFPDWNGMSDVVVACGEDAHAVDALSAAGLAGAYDGPLFLVRRDSVPPSVLSALSAIRINGVRVHVVGGESAVSTTVMNVLFSPANVGSVDRISGANRYATAAAVAREMRDVLGTLPTTALIANGADPSHFYDALALAPVAYSMHYPIMLVAQNSVPATTLATMQDLGLSTRYIAGSTASVSDGVATALGVPAPNRLQGSSRELTAIAIANKARSAGWLGNQTFAVAATLPDALAAGPMLGKKQGVMLLTRPGATTLSSPTRSYVLSQRGVLGLGIVCGGPTVIPENVRLGVMNGLNQ